MIDFDVCTLTHKRPALHDEKNFRSENLDSLFKMSPPRGLKRPNPIRLSHFYLKTTAWDQLRTLQTGRGTRYKNTEE